MNQQVTYFTVREQAIFDTLQAQLTEARAEVLRLEDINHDMIEEIVEARAEVEVLTHACNMAYGDGLRSGLDRGLGLAVEAVLAPGEKKRNRDYFVEKIRAIEID